MKRSTLILISFFVFSLPVTLSAQSAETNQIGMRLGGFSGISFRHISTNDVGIEADLLAGYHADWVMLSLLAEKHIPLGEGFTFLIGGGGFFAGDRNYHDDENNDYYWDPTVGVEGVMGFDYYFTGVPLNIGLDLRPRFSFFTEPLLPWDAGLSLHYIF